LKDVADGRYDGKPLMLDIIQTLENPVLREYLKLSKKVEGVVVHSPFKSDAAYPLKEWDVITHVGETPIDNQGMVKIGANLRVFFKYRVQQIAKNMQVPLTIIRAGQTLKVNVPVYSGRPHLIGDLKGGYPSYFIFGPIVFSRATVEFMSFLGNSAAAINAYAYTASPLVTRRGDAPDSQREELVVVSSPFFPHKLVTGYSNRFGAVIYSINNQPIRSLKHLVEVLRDLKDDLIVIHFDQRYGETMVLPRKAMLEETESILSDNGIRTQASADLMEVWNKK
jgi:hypothetical protein